MLQELAVFFIRIVGTHNTINEVFLPLLLAGAVPADSWVRYLAGHARLRRHSSQDEGFPVIPDTQPEGDQVILVFSNMLSYLL